ADRLYRRVVQFARIWSSGTVVVSNLHRTWIAGVPSPRQTQFPCPSMSPERRAKCCKLEPPQIQLSREFRRWDKSADVRSPIRNSTQASIHREWNMRLQCFPSRKNVPRPQKRSVPLHSRISISMQSKRSLIRTINLRSFPVHAV